MPGLIRDRRVHEVGVDGGVGSLEEDAAAVELEAVLVDGDAVGVLVASLHFVLEQELRRGRAALVPGLVHGGAERQIDLRRAGDG